MRFYLTISVFYGKWIKKHLKVEMEKAIYFLSKFIQAYGILRHKCVFFLEIKESHKTVLLLKHSWKWLSQIIEK